MEEEGYGNGQVARAMAGKVDELEIIRASMKVAFWYDATVNGVPEHLDAPVMPFLEADIWTIEIDVWKGRIIGWPQGTTATVDYKVRDQGCYEFLTADGVLLHHLTGYVPAFLSPLTEGFGDYVNLEIDEDGFIAGWQRTEIVELVKKSEARNSTHEEGQQPLRSGHS